MLDTLKPDRPSPMSSVPRRLSAIAAHRGGAALWPENSLAAFRGAAALGVAAVEFDIHLTADGEIVVIHDPTLDRTTDGRGAIAEMTYADVAQARLRGGAVPSERVPRLSDVLAVLAPAGIIAWIEIKTRVDGTPYDGLETRLAAVVHGAGYDRRTVMTTFAWDAIERLARTGAPIERSGNVSTELFRRHGGFEGCCHTLAGRGAHYITPDYRLVTPQDAAMAARHGLKMAVWTVNAEADLECWLAADVTAVITDRPDLAQRVRSRMMEAD